MTTLVIGANGQIGKQLCQRLADDGRQVTAMLRTPAQAENFDHDNISTIIADLSGDFQHAFEQVNEVVFTAGSGTNTGFDQTLLIDLWAAIKAVDYCQTLAVKRFIMVSSRGAQNPDNGPERIKPYLCAKFAADFYLQKSALDFTILQPGRLTHEPPSHRFTCNRPPQADLQIISRANVVEAIHFCLNHRQTVGKTYELFEGPHPLASALGVVEP